MVEQLIRKAFGSRPFLAVIASLPTRLTQGPPSLVITVGGYSLFLFLFRLLSVLRSVSFQFLNFIILSLSLSLFSLFNRLKDCHQLRKKINFL
jgi:hypothetical protein